MTHDELMQRIRNDLTVLETYYETQAKRMQLRLERASLYRDHACSARYARAVVDGIRRGEAI